MGRIKTDMVKRTARKLVKMYPNRFSKSFERNKEALDELAEVRTKKLRNVIAGYTVRLKTLGEDRPVKPRKPAYPPGRGRGPQRGGFQRRGPPVKR